MKALRIFAIVLGSAIALVALLVAVALVPAVQTWAVRKAVANQPGLKLDVGHVAAGFSAADLNDVHVVKDGIVITAKRATAHYSAWDFVTHRRINVDDLTVDDLVVDLRASGSTPATKANVVAANERSAGAAANPAAKPAPEPRAPFDGLLNAAKLPYDVRIARFSIPGRALLSANQTATFELHGSDIATGQHGTVDWKVDLTDSAADAPMRALHSTGTAGIHITTERRIDVAEVNALASAEGAKLPSDQLKLEAKAEQPAANGNEGYTAHVSLVRGQSAEPLLTVAAQYDAAAHEISGAWNVTVRTEQLAAMLSGFGLPETAVSGSGKFSAKPDAGAINANGELLSDVSHLEKVSPELASIGKLRLQTRFDGGVANNVAQIAQFTLTATAADGRKFAQIDALQKVAFSLADKRVTFADAKADLARISLQSLPLAWAQPFAKPLAIESGDLSLALAVAAEADGSRVRLTPVEPLALHNVTVRNGTQKLADQVSLTAKPQAEYSAERVHAEINELTITTPAGDAVNGRVTADITHPSGAREIAFTSDTQAKLVALLKPYLPVDTGPLAIASKASGTLAGQTLRITSATTHVTRASGPLLANVELQQPLTIDLKTTAIAPEKPGTDTARVQLGEIPLAWAQPFVPNSKLAGQVSGATLQIAMRSIDDVSANTTQPIVLRGVTAALNGRAMLQNLDVTLDFSGAKQGENVRYDVRRLEAKQGTTSLANLVVAGTAKLGAKPTVSAKGKLQADVAAWLQQPVAAAYASLSRGTIQADFDATVADTIQAKATLAARGLVAKQNNQPLGDAELNLTAAVQSDGSSVLTVPFTLTNGGRKSDVSLDGKLSRSGNTINFDGKITSNQLFVDDLKPLAGLAPSSGATSASGQPANSAPAQPTRAGAATRPGVANAGTTAQPGTSVAANAPARDTQPFWSAAGGKIEVDLKQINYGRDYVISGVRGSAAITPARLALNGLEGRFKDNPFKVSATIDFDAKQPKPYTLVGAANVAGFDVGAFFRAANPNVPPQLETTVTVDAKLNGKGAVLDDLIQNTYGTFDVTGSQGTLRALAKKGASTAVNIGSNVLGALGSGLLGGKQSDTATALAKLTQKFAAMPFDKLVMHVERAADLNINISRLEFIASDIHIVGNGQITNRPGVPLLNQPLNVKLVIGSKEEFEYLFNRLGVLSGQRDEVGYSLLNREFAITGTPGDPNSSDLWTFLGEIALREGASLIPKLFGK